MIGMNYNNPLQNYSIVAPKIITGAYFTDLF